MAVGCSDTGCDTSGAVFEHCSSALHDYLYSDALARGPVDDALSQLLGKPPYGDVWTSASCGQAIPTP